MAWKTDTYPDAWAYMQWCAQQPADPGYIVNPWGRYRRFAETNDQGLLRAFGRESMNFPVQSTVADTCLIALHLLVEYRKAHRLGFRIVNQIHDAILLEVPMDEIDETRAALNATMGGIAIPIPNRPLVLGVEIDAMDRWGEKRK